MNAPNARSWMDEAQALALADRVPEALELLLGRRETLKRVPPMYDAAIGRLLLRRGDAAEAVAYLLRARDGMERAPPALQRDLAMAMMAAGRVESAGGIFQELLDVSGGGARPGWAARADCLAAIEAFRNSATDELDAGPPTPYRIFAQAMALAERSDTAGAVALLRARRADWKNVPPEYEAVTLRLSHATRDREAEVARLRLAWAGCSGPPAENITVPFGTALWELGRQEEAGEAFSEAIAQGARNLHVSFLIAAEEYRRRVGDTRAIDTSFSKPFTFVDTVRRLAYVAVPKNASTLLKANFVLNSSHRDAYLAERGAVHEFGAKLVDKAFTRNGVLGPDYVRFTVLRDPYRRLVSAYLQKFVRRWRDRASYLACAQMEETILGAQGLAGVAFDPVRSISFEEFVRFLATVGDNACNPHWLPQFRAVGRDLSLYHHVGKVERLDDTLAFLRARLGFVVESRLEADMPIAARHIAKYGSDSELQAPYAALPRALDALEGNVPPPDRFYTPELRQLVEQRFAEDFALYAAA